MEFNTPDTNNPVTGNSLNNMQNSPLFTDGPEKKSNTAVIILIVVLVLVVAGGVILFLLSKKPTTPTGEVVSPTTETTQTDPFGQQQSVERPVATGSDLADINNELSDITSELENLDLGSLEEELSSIDDIINDIDLSF